VSFAFGLGRSFLRALFLGFRQMFHLIDLKKWRFAYLFDFQNFPGHAIDFVASCSEGQ